MILLPNEKSEPISVSPVSAAKGYKGFRSNFARQFPHCTVLNQESAKFECCQVSQLQHEMAPNSETHYLGDRLHAAPPGGQPGAGADAARETGQQG